MTPPQRKIHYGRVKMAASQALALADGVRQLNVPPDAELEIKMELGQKMSARIRTADGSTAIGELECELMDNGAMIKITPLSPTA